MAKAKQYTEAEVKRRIKGLPRAEAARVVCALVGHSGIVTGCMGYVYCARCDAQVGDQLMGVYAGAEASVRVGHNCDTCRKNYKAMGWQHKLLAPNPFTKPESAPGIQKRIPGRKQTGADVSKR